MANGEIQKMKDVFLHDIPRKTNGTIDLHKLRILTWEGNRAICNTLEVQSGQIDNIEETMKTCPAQTGSFDRMRRLVMVLLGLVVVGGLGQVYLHLGWEISAVAGGFGLFAKLIGWLKI